MKLTTLLALLLVTAASMAQNPGSLPDSIKTYTILVMKAEKGIMQKMYNRNLQTAFSGTYTGPFELIGKKDLEDPKYADLSKYRYTVNYYETGSIRQEERKPNGQYIEKVVPFMDIVFHDRLMKKDLNRPGISTTTYIDAMRQPGKLLEKKDK